MDRPTVIILGAGVVLMPDFPVVRVIVLSQVLNGMLLPFVLVFMLLLVNKRELMGKHVNSLLLNVITWVTAAVVVLLTVGSLFTT